MGVKQEAVTAGGRDLRLRRVRRQLLQRHRARVLRPGLSRAWLDGQAVSGWFLAMAIISTFWLLVFVSICRCAFCYVMVEQEVGVDKAVGYKAALPKLLREF